MSHKASRPSPILITGRFRSGTTLLWKLFRQLDKTVAFYNPLHEYLKSYVEYPIQADPSHLVVKPYFDEYRDIFDIVSLHRSEFSSHKLLLEEEQEYPELQTFIRSLLLSVPSGKIPVLQFNNIDFRLAWLKQKFPNVRLLHIFRNPRHQWLSELSSFSSDIDKTIEFDHFFSVTWARDIYKHFPFLATPQIKHAYQRFYYIWKLSYLSGKRLADLSVSYEDVLQEPTKLLGKILRFANLYSDKNLDICQNMIVSRPDHALRKEKNNFELAEIEQACEDVLDDLGLNTQFASIPINNIQQSSYRYLQLLNNTENDKWAIKNLKLALAKEREVTFRLQNAYLKERIIWNSELDAAHNERDVARNERTVFRNERDVARNERTVFRNERDIARNEREAIENVLHQIYQSRSWRITAPVRFVIDKGRIIFQKARRLLPLHTLPKRGGRKVVHLIFRWVLKHPALYQLGVDIFKHFPSVEKRLKQIESYAIADIPATTVTEGYSFDKNYHQYEPTSPVLFPLLKGERIIYYYVDHTIQCPSNTGMQQLTRRLGRAFQEAGEKIYFVKWDADHHQFILLDQDEVAYLSQWHGPALSSSALEQYPKPGDNTTIPVGKHELAAGHWLVVPEVTHITYQAQPMTLDVLMEAKRQGLKTAFVYYDATPLSRADLNEMASNHETYMQQLLLSDLIVPISNWSARELTSFFHVHEEAVLTQTPRIAALPLPGESQLASRVTKPVTLNETSKFILSIGSIVPHKNQVALIHAFERYCEAYPETDWQLLLAGNLHPDLISEIKRATEQNSRIKHLGYVPNDKLDELYRSCAFTVFPSVLEGFGLPILESLWYAKPCVCANFGAMGEAAQGGGCLTIDTRDTSELLHAITRMTTDPDLLEQLSKDASIRPITVWTDYAQRFVELLDETGDPIKMQMGSIYYWVDHTVTYPKNTGIQRVVRSLARALLENGYKVIPVKWDKDSNKFYSPSEKELHHLARWNGPQPSDWSTWVDFAHATANDWVLIPELVSDPIVNLKAVKNYVAINKIRCAWLFYDTIPWKMSADFPIHVSDAHRQYMENLNEFELIFPISHFSRRNLISFLAALPCKMSNLENRILTCSLPGEFLESRRLTNIKQENLATIKILCVGTIEPRKKHLVLLQAFSQVIAQTHRSVELIIVGGDPYPELAAQVKHYIKTNPGVRWEKDVSDENLSELYDSCDFTVYPSMEEGFGLPILESMWFAKPCICRNSGAMMEAAEEGGCLMVETTDPDALTDAMLRLVEDDVLRLELSEEAVNRQFKTWHSYAREIVTRMATERHVPLRQFLPEPIDRTGFYDKFVNLHPRPLLSICISTYNREEWLAVSLKNLTRILPNPHTDIEIVVCDNASSDHTPDVVKPYQKRADFRYYRNPTNVGMLGNLRVTAHHARGRYIWILGDDDLVKPGSIEKILQVIQTHPDTALVYLNYAYTRQDDAKEVTDLDVFLNESTPIVSPGRDIVGPVSRISTQSENFFTAIYCLVFRRDHALRAYSQNTEGRPFSTMLSCIPTTYYTLNFMMKEPAYWVGEPQLVVNMNVSWMKYAPLWILERLPEAHELAEKMGADPVEIDRCRNNHIPHVMFWFRDIYHHDEESNMIYFSPSRLITRIKHLDSFVGQVQTLRTFYEHVYVNWQNPGAKIPPAAVFPSFEIR
jgi:glycosyltransferase involved in cell wall biosynthesis